MTLYALQPDPVTGSLDDATVISQSKHGWEFLEQAITLWHLVAPQRADELEALKRRLLLTNPNEELRIFPEDLRELVRLLLGIEDAIVLAGITDQQWRVPAEHLEALARRVPAMDLQTDRPVETKTNALGEVISNAILLRNFLSNAAKEDCVVVLG